jgi:Na+-translocating ferredoxin:NAD+ oxidoreductase RnfG subunit
MKISLRDIFWLITAVACFFSGVVYQHKKEIKIQEEKLKTLNDVLKATRPGWP